MEPTIEESATLVELPQPVVAKGESLKVQLGRVLVVNVIAFAASKVAERAFDKYIVPAVTKKQPLAEIKDIHA